MKINNNLGSWEIKSDKSNLSWNPNEDLNIKDQWWGDASIGIHEKSVLFM